MVDVPEDLRNLNDFPTYDASFQDGPKFRQCLSHWALKTDKLSASLTNLAESFEQFHSSGLEHHKAAISVVQGLQEVASHCGNNRGNTIAGPVQKFTEVLNSMWCYYEAFLGQTLMLNAEPLQELALTFNNLKKLYEELLHYRKEYISAAEKLCACRHITKATDAQFSSLTEACYTTQKTYRLVLSKYVVSLRQAHTQDMMTFMRRTIEHLLSIYSYHNFATQVMKEIEPEVNELFTKTKEWKLHYEDEVRLWKKLQQSIQRNVLAEFQHNMGLIPPSPTDSTLSWSDTTAQLGRSVLKPILKMLPGGGHPQKDSKTESESTSDWYLVDGCEDGDCSNLDSRPRMLQPAAQDQKEVTKSPRQRHKPVLRTYSIPIQNEGEEQVQPRKRLELKARRKLVRSVSDPDLLASKSLEQALQDAESANGSIPGKGTIHSSLRESEKPKVVRLKGKVTLPNSVTLHRHSSSPQSMEEYLYRTSSHPSHSSSGPFRPLAAILSRSRAKHREKEDKKLQRGGKVFSSMEDLTAPSSSAKQLHSGSSTPEEPSPLFPRKGSKGPSGGIFKRAKESLLHKVSPSDRGEHPTSPPSQDQPEKKPGKSNGSIIRASSPDDLDLLQLKRTKNKNSPSSSKEEPKGRSGPYISPAIIRKRSDDSLSSFDLHSLIDPVNPNWIKSGYLWLRMKLPNNRYAWTFIFCVIDRVLGQLMVQEQSLPEPRPLENLLLCTTKPCTPDFIDRNFCFRVISPTSEHLFQTLNAQELQVWVSGMQEATAEALKNSDGIRTFTQQTMSSHQVEPTTPSTAESVPDAMSLILGVLGNRHCADCNSTGVEWASINLGIVLCITCSGVHRGLGVHVSKVRSLNLDKWDRPTVEFMLSQGNDKSNSYYEALLGEHTDIRKPAANTNKSERTQFIRQKYVSLAFVPDIDERGTHL